MHQTCLPGNQKTLFVKSHLKKGKKKKFRLFPGALGLGLLRAAPCGLSVLGAVPGTPQSLEAAFCPDLALFVPAPGTHHTRQCPGPRLALCPKPPGQDSDHRLTRQREVSCFDDKRGSRGTLALRRGCGAWGPAGGQLWAAPSFTSRWWAAPWEVRGWKTQSLSEATMHTHKTG